MRVELLQEAIQHEGADGWLFFDHHRRDPLAYRILSLPSNLNPTRRWFYFVPAKGEPIGLSHRIEPHSLDSLPGKKLVYSRWSELQSGLRAMLRSVRRICMQYSPLCAVPYVSMVDAGTIEQVHEAAQCEIVSSANLVQLFEARWTHAQWESHVDAGKKMDRLRAEAFAFTGEQLSNPVSEWDVHSFLRKRFTDEGLFTDHGPIVAVNQNASDPHYEPTRERSAQIKPGDLLLIDMWAKLAEADAVYYDITWTGYVGDTAPFEIQNVFEVVTAARDTAVSLVQNRIGNGESLQGFEVDDAARKVIDSRGFGDYFFHRTGHSIGTEVHGAGANMDNLETHDTRSVITSTCFSIEPGVYLPKFGIRSEVNVYIAERGAEVTGEIQRELVKIG